MEKNVRLADIYVKIYNKQPLMMEDLAFLAKYDRECFEKTCYNLIYNIPEAKELMKPIPSEGAEDRQEKSEESAEENPRIQQEMQKGGAPAEAAPQEVVSDTAGREEQRPEIGVLLDNLKKMEWQEMPVPNLDAGKVKNLLGSLYMEMMFPHNDRYRYFDLEESSHRSIFNKKV
ncbi:MAG: hypothetical protein HFJ05_08105 [Eubacterium sp.]|nr:hypothetical protein [Eubacterium sp.]